MREKNWSCEERNYTFVKTENKGAQENLGPKASSQRKGESDEAEAWLGFSREKGKRKQAAKWRDRGGGKKRTGEKIRETKE